VNRVNDIVIYLHLLKLYRIERGDVIFMLMMQLSFEHTCVPDIVNT